MVDVLGGFGELLATLGSSFADFAGADGGGGGVRPRVDLGGNKRIRRCCFRRTDRP